MHWNKYKSWYIALGTVLFFILAKLSTLSFRFGDENVYFYMSQAILDGLLPHRDFFLADPPVFVYIMAFFKMLFGSHLILFKTLPIIFDSISAVLIFLLLKDKNRLAFLAPVFYLASFTVISTSDYVTGAEIMIPFILLALLFDQKGRPLWSGVMWALACLCKLYAGPALLGFLLYKVIKKEWGNLKEIILGGLLTTFIIMLPFFLLAPQQTFYNLFTHQFNRPVGINKWNIFAVFLKFEWLFVLGGIIAIFKIKNRIWILPFVFSALFFLLYRDLYYLYLHILMPFIIILFVELSEKIYEKQKELFYFVVALIVIIFFYSASAYNDTYQGEGIFRNPGEVAEALRNTPEDLPVYGLQEVTPLVALMSGKKIFQNIIDTNTQNFASGTHNKIKISEEAVKEGIYLVTRVGYYPAQGVVDTGFENYFDRGTFDKYCTPYMAFDHPSFNDPLNQIKIYKCKESK
ncbi:MAG: glycosyltransferase family 39 protein [Candidatus Paceibacterota bacterium]|jgi:hypothetical protein